MHAFASDNEQQTEGLQVRKLHGHKLPMGVLGADISPDGETIYAACMDGAYELDLRTGRHELLTRHESFVSGAALLKKANQLVTAGYDGYLQWFNLECRREIRRQKLHDFWSWQMAVSPDEKLLASVTGQYLAGGYKYEPKSQSDPCVCIVDAETGEFLLPLEHVPSVQSVAFSNDGQYVAAGNLMGEIRIWEIPTGKLAATWTSPDFTSWGIIKSHCYIGGVFALQFTPDDQHLLLAGMGPMRDPMAGNGRQLWQRFAWRETPARKVDETHDQESGEGLMETLALSPRGDHFVMAGRLRGGAWNAGFFDMESGELLTSLKTKCRITKAAYSVDGARLVLAGAQGQPRTKDGTPPPFGRVDVFEIAEMQQPTSGGQES